MEPSHRPGLGLFSHIPSQNCCSLGRGRQGPPFMVRLGRLHSRSAGEGQTVIRLCDRRMEGTAWPGAGAVPLWDVHSQVFTETTHRTYVYQTSDTAATSRLHVRSPCPGLGDTCAEETAKPPGLSQPRCGPLPLSLNSLRGTSLEGLDLSHWGADSNELDIECLLPQQGWTAKM